MIVPHVFSFPFAAVTNDHKLSGLKQQDVLSCSPGVKSGLKARCQRGAFPPRTSGRGFIALLFQLLEATCLLRLRAPGPVFTASSSGWLPFPIGSLQSPLLSPSSLVPPG